MQITFADQNGRPLEIEEKVAKRRHCLLINRDDSLFYRTKNKKIRQRIWILSFAINMSNKCGKQLLDAALDALKTSTKKVAHEKAEVTGEFIRNKIADKIVKPVEEIIFHLKKEKKYWTN